MALGTCAHCGRDTAPTDGISISLSDGRKFCQKCMLEYLRHQAELGDQTAIDLLDIVDPPEAAE